MKKFWTLFFINVALWVYCFGVLLTSLIQPKSTVNDFLRNNFFSFNSWFSRQIGQVQHLVFDWTFVVFIVLVIGIFYLLLKFWKVTFAILQFATSIIIIWTFVSVLRHEIFIGNPIILIILVVSLMNIGLSSKAVRP